VLPALHNLDSMITLCNNIWANCVYAFILQAPDALVQLIKDHGRWVDLPEPEEAEATPVAA
jgi:hypothetical protein